MKRPTIKELEVVLADLNDPSDPLLDELEKDDRQGVKKLVKKKRRDLDKLAHDQAELDRMLTLERDLWAAGFKHVAGIDEVGRGPLAGPVISCAVILPSDFSLLGVKDSKQLTARRRKELMPLIEDQALDISFGIRSAQDIDRLNILQATKQSMLETVANLSIAADYLLVDAEVLDSPIPQQALIQGDRQSVSIACASILAKEKRDQLMERYEDLYPGYGFAQHVGYGTSAHLHALKDLGPCPIHRRSFGPVKNYL